MPSNTITLHSLFTHSSFTLLLLFFLHFFVTSSSLVQSVFDRSGDEGDQSTGAQGEAVAAAAQADRHRGGRGESRGPQEAFGRSEYLFNRFLLIPNLLLILHTLRLVPTGLTYFYERFLCRDSSVHVEMNLLRLLHVAETLSPCTDLTLNTPLRSEAV